MFKDMKALEALLRCFYERLSAWIFRELLIETRS